MPMQSQQNASFASRLGARVSAANAEHKDKPVDTGNRRLPAGIRNGVAKLSTMYTKEYDSNTKEEWQKGQIFFRASAIVMWPKEHEGEKVDGMVTSQMVPLCDVPERGKRKATSFNENWFDFQNIFKLLNFPPCPETPQTDPTGQKTEAYFFAAMRALTAPGHPPVYISFSTRGWTPPPTPQQPKPEEMVFEDWHGLAPADLVAKAVGTFNPAAAVNEAPPVPTAPAVAAPPVQQPPVAPPSAPVAGTPAAPANGQTPDLEDLVAALIETAMGDAEGRTDDGRAAHAKLEDLAWKAGWTKEQTANAADWAAVGDMALSKPTAATPTAPVAPPTAAPSTNGAPTVGSRWMFSKRTKDGSKLKNAKGEDFPPQEVEVTTLDAGAKTCTVKAVKDGKDIIDIRTKQPTVVKFEWLEKAPAY